MAILITGGAGYIGSHICAELLDRGEEIIVMDNFFNSDPGALDAVKEITGKDFKIYEADMLDMPAVDNIFDENDIEMVIHCAGYKCASDSIGKPLVYYSNNLRGTFNILETMKKYGCTKFIFSSSATVYGICEKSPITEDFPVASTNPYSSTKLIIDALLHEMYEASGKWTMIALRYYQPIGAHSSGLIGNRTLLREGLSGLSRIIGVSYPPPDKSGVADYIHVTDLAKAHYAAVKKARELDGGHRVYNLGSGKCRTDTEVAEVVKKVCGITVETPPRETANAYLSTALAEKELGWKAQLTLEDMCRDAWSFVQKHK